MIPPPPPTCSQTLNIPPPPSSSVIMVNKNSSGQLPPPPSLLPSDQPKKKLIKKSIIMEEKIEEIVIENTKPAFVVDPSLIVKDHCSLPVLERVGNYQNLKILLVMGFSRPNHSAGILKKSIEKSIVENGRCPEIVLTPELWNASRFMSTPDGKIVMNKELEEMGQVMKNYKCYGFIGCRVWGVDEQLKPLNTYYNALIVINPDGDVLGCYRKRVPTSAERSTPGDTVGIFDTIYGRIAVLICFDIENQVILDEVLAYKPFLILNPTHIGSTGLTDSSYSAQSIITKENEEKSRRFQVKIALEALGRNFEKLCMDNNVNILRCDTPVNYGGRGTHQLMTPYSTIYPPSFYAENDFSFYVDRNDLKKSNNISIDTELPERERTHDEDNVGTRYTLFSNSHQDCILKSDKPAPNFRVCFFNHNRLICSDKRRITVVNTDIMACENLSLDHVTMSIDSEGIFKVNDSQINNEIQISDIWARFDKKHLVVLMSDGSLGLFKVVDEERQKVPNNSILALEKQFKLDSSIVDQNSRLVALHNNMLFVASQRSITQLGNLSGGEFIGKTFSLDHDFSQLVNISDSVLEYLSLDNNVVHLISLDLSTGSSSLSYSSEFNVESGHNVRLESSLEPQTFNLTEFNPLNGNVTSITPFKALNNQLTILPPLKLPENSSFVISLNSSKFFSGDQDGSLKLLDPSSSDLIRHNFHPVPSVSATRVVSLFHDKQYGRLISIHQHKSIPNEHLLAMTKFGNNRFVANLVTLFK